MCRACPTSDLSHPTRSTTDLLAEPHRSLPVSDYVLWFENYTDSDRARVGGKNASLGTMIQAGLPVPPGFAVTIEAYETLKGDVGRDSVIDGLLAEIDTHDSTGLREVSTQVRKIIEEIPVTDEILQTVRESYHLLEERCGVENVAVAVRSSATAEDLPDASFAGQQDTYLWVKGADAVIENVRRCWSSVYTDRAISYRHEMNHDHDRISMAVGVQMMVDPKAAGVAFTLNPQDGDRSQVAIDASWGLGEAVVSGEVTPDNFLVDKVIGEIVRRIISPKTIEYRVDGDNSVVKVEVEEERQSAACLTDDEIRAVATMARRAEKHYGTPQDVEWAIDRHLPDGENVVLLQARPETVWSRKKPNPIATSSNPLESIISTLMTPIHARDQ